jgi:putative hydrolase of the HAD superfamily
MDCCKAIILDLDDTLYPEREFVVGGVAAAADWLASTAGVDACRCAGELLELLDGGIRGRTFDVWLDHAGLPATLASGMVTAYRTHIPRIGLHADVEPFFLECRQRGVPLALLTDGYLEVQRRKVAALAIAPALHTIVYSDTFGRECWKPSSVPFRACLSELKIDPAQALYVGDNPEKDFLGARSAGIPSIRIRRAGGFYAAHEPRSDTAAPDSEVRSLEDVASVLQHLSV